MTICSFVSMAITAFFQGLGDFSVHTVEVDMEGLTVLSS